VVVQTFCQGVQRIWLTALFPAVVVDPRVWSVRIGLWPAGVEAGEQLVRRVQVCPVDLVRQFRNGREQQRAGGFSTAAGLACQVAAQQHRPVERGAEEIVLLGQVQPDQNDVTQVLACLAMRLQRRQVGDLRPHRRSLSG
jgi:hypothetical protein